MTRFNFGGPLGVLQYYHSRSSNINVLPTVVIGLIRPVFVFFLQSFYTVGVVVVIMFCYCFAGIIFFGSVKRGYNINGKANFESFGKTFFLLTRIATGEDWNSLMHDAMISAPYCRFEPTLYYWDSNCGHPVIAAVYFHSYIFIITYILLNVFIAFIIENFSIFYSTDRLVALFVFGSQHLGGELQQGKNPITGFSRISSLVIFRLLVTG